MQGAACAAVGFCSPARSECGAGRGGGVLYHITVEQTFLPTSGKGLKPGMGEGIGHNASMPMPVARFQ